MSVRYVPPGPPPDPNASAPLRPTYPNGSGDSFFIVAVLTDAEPPVEHQRWARKGGRPSRCPCGKPRTCPLKGWKP